MLPMLRFRPTVVPLLVWIKNHPFLDPHALTDDLEPLLQFLLKSLLVQGRFLRIARRLWLMHGPEFELLCRHP